MEVAIESGSYSAISNLEAYVGRELNVDMVVGGIRTVLLVRVMFVTAGGKLSGEVLNERRKPCKPRAWVTFDVASIEVA